jgi:hypothetical protein
VTLIIPFFANVVNASPVAGHHRQSTMPLYLLSLGRSDWHSSGLLQSKALKVAGRIGFHP